MVTMTNSENRQKIEQLNDEALKQVDGGSEDGWLIYTVVQGDTLSSIAERHHTSVQKLIADNEGLADDKPILPGKLIRFPM